MKIQSIRHALLLGTLILATGATGRGQTIINLTQDATVRSVGTYAYYARGTTSTTPTAPDGGISPWTSEFYPQYVSNKDDSLTYNGGYGAASNAGPIAFTAGTLTDNSTATKVTGYYGQTQYISTVSPTEQFGSFDVLFNLGADYVITSITVAYTDTTGAHFDPGTSAQQAYTSTTMPASDTDLSLFGSATATASTTSTLNFNGTATTAQYVDLRLDVRTSTGTANASSGAYLAEVTINGYAVSEPGSVALLLVAASGAGLWGWRRSGAFAGSTR